MWVVALALDGLDAAWPGRAKFIQIALTHDFAWRAGGQKRSRLGTWQRWLLKLATTLVLGSGERSRHGEDGERTS